MPDEPVNPNRQPWRIFVDAKFATAIDDMLPAEGTKLGGIQVTRTRMANILIGEGIAARNAKGAKQTKENQRRVTHGRNVRHDDRQT